ASGGLVALTAAGIDAIEAWADDDEESDWGPAEIALPGHSRGSVELLLAQPHPVAQAGAEAVREQLDSAQCVVWVTYPNSLRSGRSRRPTRAGSTCRCRALCANRSTCCWPSAIRCPRPAPRRSANSSSPPSASSAPPPRTLCAPVTNRSHSTRSS